MFSLIVVIMFFLLLRLPPSSTLFPYTTLFRSRLHLACQRCVRETDARAVSNGEHRSIRSEEHTSELQSRQYLVCRLLLEKKKSAKPSTLWCSRFLAVPSQGLSPWHYHLLGSIS